MRLFGLLGYPLTHSFSKSYFTEKFSSMGMGEGFVYENFSIPDIEELPYLLIQKKYLEGFNITIPYKKQVIPFLHQLTPEVAEMGACNCVRIKNKKLIGYNTDIIGFENSLKPFLQKHHTHALILGTGGAAAAVEFVLRKLNISYLNVSRTSVDQTIQYNQLNKALLSQYQLIINTSPVGQYPNVEQAPLIPYEFLGPKHHLYDLIYNPTETQFLLKGKAQGASVQNGYEMLVLQAEESWRIWNL
ncbi:shikimate dehydrogenase [Sediminibacterium sp.]|uniref:shikimate dehydrogenase family protein n=1 Tax=Sediminibacterium sp. TaxID=1917865 RepID=UPI002735BB90|nr:shikimate dehydrogenase [Sediminibacterium sp.]MDP3394919.1 shikimate dehydrogenase [Sediminibacterium sp.]MDP3565545.1 shikimate dehydrogenase [Sediminibacterium sp.]